MTGHTKLVSGYIGMLVLAALALASCTDASDEAQREHPQDAFDRIEADLGLARPPPGVEEYYGDLYAGGGDGREVSLWTLPGKSGVLPAATIFVLDEPDGFSPDDVAEVAQEVQGVWSSSEEPRGRRRGDLWIENAGPNAEGTTVGVHRGLAYMIIGSEEIGASVLEAVRS